MYKNLFIDLDDTVINTAQNAHNTFVEMYEKHQFQRYFDSFNHFYSIYQTTNTQVWKAYEKNEITKEQLNEIRFSTPLLQVGVENTTLANQFMADFFEVISIQKEVMPHAHEGLSYLAERYTLHILSNGFSGLQQKKMKAAGVDIYFDSLFLSDEIGAHKPSPEIYHHALKRANADVNSSIMIGDNWTNDVAAAKAIGMDQIYYTPKVETTLAFEPTFVMNDWLEVKKWL